MANFIFDIPADFLKQLGKLQDIDRIAPIMIDEALPTLEESFKRNLNGVLKDPTGELLASIKMVTSKKVKNGGYYGYVTAKGASRKKMYKRRDFTGAIKREEPYRNYQKILALEYGTSKQSPRPFITRTINNAEPEVLRKMQEVFNREVGD